MFLQAVGIDSIQQLVDKLQNRKDAVVEFVRRRWEGRALAAGTLYMAGFCILHLANFLASLLGPERYREICKQIRLTPGDPDRLAEQIATAEAVNAQFP